LKACLVSSGWIPIIPKKGVIYGGGIESQVYGLAKGLTKLCNEVHLITVGNNSKPQKAEGITYHQIPVPSQSPAFGEFLKLVYSDLMFAYKSARIHQKLNIDLIHCHTKFPAASTLYTGTDRPLIFTAHNWKLWEGMMPEWKSGLARSSYELDTRIERIIAHKADVVLALSEAMKRGIAASAGISSRKVEVVSNAVDAQVFYPTAATRRPSILYVGRITAEKGVDILIKAMPLILKEIPDAELTIVGPKTFGLERGGFEKQLIKLIKRLGIEEHVVFTGTLSISELREAYSRAWLSCLPSIWQEPFGLTLIEALACETPVVGTEVGGIPEVISETNGGLVVKPSDAEALAQAIIRILSDASLARRMGKNGRKAIKEKYTFDRRAERVYSIYSRLIG
jgi:glycosyltransferase involved in cell wall biosynthesis